MSKRDTGPRPAEILPPTLLPNAIHLAAPRPARLTSLLVACAIYGVMAGAVVSSARHLAQRPIKGGTTATVWKLETEFEPVPIVKPLPPPQTGGGVVPPGIKVIDPPPTSENVVPDVVRDLSKEDHSNEMVGSKGDDTRPGIVGLPPGPSPTAPPPPVRSANPVAIEASQIRILQQVNPVYPPLARLIHAQGPVELRLTIDTRGVPTDVEVISGPHALLINEAVRVAKLWRFQPATVEGEAVKATFRLTVGFKLER